MATLFLMPVARRQGLLLAVSLYCMIPAWAHAATHPATTLDRARAMLANDDAETAYRTLLPLVQANAGQPVFDSLFGQAALATHKNTRAIMAFNRCIAVAPEKGLCQLGLARAHMQLGETRGAKRQLLAIRKTSPPPQVAGIIDRYLGVLAGSSAASEQNFNAWAELSIGYDSNTNVAPSESDIALPGLAFNIGDMSIVGHYQSAEDSSAFYQAKLGLAGRVPISRHWDVVTGGRARLTRNTQVAKTSTFDQVSHVMGHLGASAHYGQQRFGLMIRSQYDGLGGQSYRNVFGLLSQYNYFVTHNTRIGGFVQLSRFDYQYGPGADLRNVNSISGGLSAMHTLLDNRLLLFTGVHAGRDDKVKTRGPDRASSDYYGLRLGATWVFLPHWQAGIKVLAEHRSHDGYALFFPERSRTDNTLSTELELAWHATKSVSLRAKYNYVHNHSNIPIRDYERTIVSFGVRYDFM